MKQHLKNLKVASLEPLVVQLTAVGAQKFGGTVGSQQVCKRKSFQIWAVLRVSLAGGCRSGLNTAPRCHPSARRDGAVFAQLIAVLGAWHGPLPKSVGGKLRASLVLP